MRHWIKVGLLSVSATLLSSQLEASFLASDMLYTDGATISHLEDDAWVSFVDEDSDGVVDTGEILFGMFDIRGVRDAEPGTQGARPMQSEMFAGVFVAQIGEIDDSHPRFWGGATIDLVPAPASAWENLQLDAPESEDTLFVFYSDPDGPQNMVDPLASGGIVESLLSATNGTKLWEFGFRGDEGANERWWIDVDTIHYLDMYELSYRGALNMTAASDAVTDIGFGDHDFFGWSHRGLTAPSEMQMTGNLESFSAGNFNFRVDSDFYVRAIPEPAALAYLVVGALAIGLGFAARRDRG